MNTDWMTGPTHRNRAYDWLFPYRDVSTFKAVLGT
jgi:hypothetical protein